VITWSDGKLTYKPHQNYFGPDTFDVTIGDGEYTSVATVKLTVRPINDAPVTKADSYRIKEDGSIVMDVLENDSDVDSTLTLLSVSGAKNGKVAIVDGKLTYQPYANFNGEERLTVIVTDGELTATTIVTLVVDSVNDAPELVDDEATTKYHTPITLDVLANDTDLENDPLTIVKVIDAKNGVATIVNNQLVYTPNALFAGTDIFSIVISDGAIERTSVVSITVLAPDAKESTPFDPTPETPDKPDDKEVEVEKPGTKGEIIIVNDTVYYTPKPGESGVDTYTITVKEDGKEVTYQVVTNIVDGKATVVGYGQPLNDENFEVANNQTLKIKLSDYLDAAQLKDAVNISIQPQFGTVSLKDGVLTYKPSKDYIGKDGVVLVLTIDNQATPFAALIQVTDAAPASFPWTCFFGWLIAAIFLAFNHKMHEIYFKPKKARTIAYIVVNTLVILTLCLLREKVGYPVALGVMLIWLVMNFFYANIQVNKIKNA